MALIIENINGSLISVSDLGFDLDTGGSIDLVLESNPSDVARSASGAGNDLFDLITIGSLVVKDPIDGVSNLSIADGITACREHNETHYRLGSGARISDASDVNLAGLTASDVMQWNGTEFVIATPADIAGDVETSIDHANIIGNGTNSHSNIDSHIFNNSIHFTQNSISITESQISDLQTYTLTDGSKPFTDDIVGTDFINTRAGSITRVNGLITQIDKVGGRSLVVSRDINNRIATIADGTRTYTFNRTNGKITDWTVT